MPLLQYRCPACGKTFEELVKKFTDEIHCPECGKTAERCYCGAMFTATGKKTQKCSGNCSTCGGCK